MRLRTAAPVLVALLLGAGACSGGEGTTASVDAGDDGAARAELASAISAAQEGMPVPVSNSRVGVLLEDLCDGGSGIRAQLGQLPLTDADQADAVIRALTAGTDLLCPEGVDAGAAAQARAAAISVAPSTTAADLSGSAEGSGGNVAVGTAGRTSAASSSSASGGSSSGTNGGAANGSTGTATVGGGGANGTGNQSSSSFSQSVGGSGSSNSASAG
jgi:hypothetical protein